MGIGIFAVWPLAKKFGKRNVTLIGFLLYSLGSAICWLVPANLYVVLVGQFIKNIGGLPCAYVFMALFADGLDHIEWKSGIRCDGTAMSIYNIIAVAIVGVATSIFNAMISGAGYIAPPDGATVEQIQQIVQPELVKNVITFAFVGLESITGLILAGLLIFLSVEKTISRKQAMIRQRQKAAAKARGEEWIAPGIQAEIDEKKFLEEGERIFAEELKAKCQKKGLNFEEELEKHNKQVSEQRAKQENKKRLAEEKGAANANKTEQKKAVKLVALTPEQLALREEKARKRQEREDALWAEELKKGETYYQKIQVELAAKSK